MATNPRIVYDILANAEGGSDVERLARALEQVDEAIDPAAAARAQALAAELRQLGAQQAAIGRFVELKTSTAEAARALTDAQAAAQQMGRELAATETPTRAQSGAMQKLADAVRAAKGDLQAQTAALDGARANLSALGVSTDSLASAEVRLRGAIEGTVAGVRELGQQQQAVARFQELAAATDKARAALVASEGALSDFRARMVGVTEPTASETRELTRLTEAARQSQIAVQGAAAAQAQAGAALRAAGVDTERLVAAQSRVPPTLAATAAASERVSAEYREQGAAAAASAAKQTAATGQIAAGVDSIARKLDNLRNIGLAGVLGSQTGQLLQGLAETADAYGNLGARIKLVTGEGEAFRTAFDGVYKTAIRTNSSLEGTGTLFSRIAQAGKEIGVGQAEALRLTESINQAVQLSGASAQASDAAITQLIQGLQSGVLRGEEFNSVMEQAPRLAQALAAGLGVTTGELRKLAGEGRLTSETVIRALQSQADALSGEFQKLPATVGRAVQNLNTEWQRLVGTFNESSGATAVIAEGINALAANLDSIARLATAGGAALVAALAVKGVSALRALSVEMAATAGGAGLLSASLSRIPTLINVTVAAVGFEVFYEIGKLLRENSELARKFGVGVTEFLVGLVNDLQFLKEAATAVFSDDTIGDAFDRFKARAEEQRAIFADLYREAEQSPAAIKRATDEAAAATAGLGAAAGTAGAQVQQAAAGAASSLGGVGTAAASAGAAAGAALKHISDETKAAQKALVDLAGEAGVSLPAVGVTARQQAEAIVALAAKSRDAAKVIAEELPEAIGKLSGGGLAEFRAAFVGALEDGIARSRRLGDALAEAGESGERALAAAEAQGRLLQTVIAETGRQAAASLGVDVAALATGLSKEFRAAQEDLATLIRSMPALRDAGVDAGAAVAQALAKMVDGAKSQAELDALRVRIEALGTSGQLSGAQVRGALHSIGDKADELREKLEDLTPGMQNLGEAARAAGVDIERLTTGVGRGFDDGLRVLRDLREQIEGAGIAAERASPILAEAIDKRIEAAATRDELGLLRAEIDKARESGVLLGAAGADALDRIATKARELSPAFQQAQRDAELLGIKLRGIGADAEAGSEVALKAYERLKAGGVASQADIQAAFAKTAAEATRAAGGIAPAWVQAEAAVRGMVVEVDRFGGVLVRVAQTGEQAGRVVQRSLEDAAVAADRLLTELENVAEARNRAVKSVLGSADDVLDASGRVVGRAGSTVFGGPQVQVPKGYTFDQQAFDRDQAMAARMPGSRAPNPANYYRAPSLSSGSTVAGGGGLTPEVAARLKAIEERTTPPPPTVPRSPTFGTSTAPVTVKFTPDFESVIRESAREGHATQQDGYFATDQFLTKKNPGDRHFTPTVDPAFAAATFRKLIDEATGSYELNSYRRSVRTGREFSIVGGDDGEELLRRIDRRIEELAEGRAVGPSRTVNINLQVGPRAVGLTGTESQANALLAALQQAQRSAGL